MQLIVVVMAVVKNTPTGNSKTPKLHILHSTGTLPPSEWASHLEHKCPELFQAPAIRTDVLIINSSSYTSAEATCWSNTENKSQTQKAIPYKRSPRLQHFDDLLLPMVQGSLDSRIFTANHVPKHTE